MITHLKLINSAHSLIKHLMIKSAGKIVYDTDNVHNITLVKNLLEYSDEQIFGIIEKHHITPFFSDPRTFYSLDFSFIINNYSTRARWI